MIKRSLVALIFMTLLLTACASAARSPSSTAQEVAPALPAAPPVFQSAPGAADKSAGAAPAQNLSIEGNTPLLQTGQTIDSTSAADRIVIKNASLAIIVVDPAKAMDTVTQLANTMGGFVVTSNLTKTTTDQGTEVPEANITIRVPADKLTDAMNQIKALVKDPAIDITSENVTGQDVTKEYTDLQSQLDNLQKAEAQLREIMASASNTQDVLSVYNQLTQIQGQIEVIQGQIKYYDDSSKLSAIDVQLTSEAAVQPLTIGGWQPVGVARDALQALINTMKFLGSAAIWLIIFVLPIVIVLYLVVRLIIWIIRRLRRNKKTIRSSPVPPTAAA
jgi:hypothetical protein